jgi:hypothetical protein
MSDTSDFMAAYQNHQKAVAEANAINKGAVFDALVAAGITSVKVEFNGEGDSGQIEDTVASAGETPVKLPANPVTLQEASWNSDKLSTKESTLSEAVETLCYDYLEQEHGGWENNDGAFGTFEFDVGGRTIQLEFNGRYTDVAITTHSF